MKKSIIILTLIVSSFLSFGYMASGWHDPVSENSFAPYNQTTYRTPTTTDHIGSILYAFGRVGLSISLTLVVVLFIMKEEK